MDEDPGAFVAWRQLSQLSASVFSRLELEVRNARTVHVCCNPVRCCDPAPGAQLLESVGGCGRYFKRQSSWPLT